MRNNRSSVNVGDIFTSSQGELCTVIKYINCSRVLVRFHTKDNYEREVRSDHLRNGCFNNPFFKSVCGTGYLGLGKHKARKGKKMTKAYQCWNDMLKRCYDHKVQERYPSYKGCTVHPDWHNFQNFSEWFNSNKFNIAGYELDKDAITPKNKIYSADNCSLLPREVNIVFRELPARDKLLPVGVHYQTGSRIRGYTAILTGNGKDGESYLGSFCTTKEAHHAYVVAKEAYVKDIAKKWHGRIDERVYNALMSWSVVNYGEQQ